MRRFLTLVFLLVLAVPAGVTFSGCTRNPDANYCNGLGYGARITDLYSITLTPQYTGISLAYGQTRQSAAPAGINCKNGAVSVSNWSYGTTNNRLVDISPSGNICAGTWNRNTGGGIADYTICSAPNPAPVSKEGLPYAVAYITAAAQGITSNPVPVYVHQQVTSVGLVGPTDASGNSVCTSQNQVAQLDAQACYTGADGTKYEFCAPATLSADKYNCKATGTVPTCESSIGTMTFTLGTASVGTINPETNQITANLPGTTVITASIAGASSTAGYFSTCPPANIAVTLNGSSTGATITQGVQQNMVTTITDTKGNPITGLTLDYQSTNPQNVSVSSTGAITASYPGSGTVYAVCQPSECNPAPTSEIGVQGTGLPISSNPIDITVPGTASAYFWVGAPGQSQYFVPYELITGTPGSTVRLPYVPNSMMMDKLGTSLYFGSQTELMVYSATSNSLTGQYTAAPGVVLAVAPNNSEVLVNDQTRGVFYIVGSTGTVSATFKGWGVSAQWTPDSQTLYIEDSASANNLPANVAAGITGHTDTLYVYNANTNVTTYPLNTVPSDNPNALAVMVPGVGAFIAGQSTVAHTYCPTGTPSDYSTMVFYPQAGDPVAADTQSLAATTDGQHILGASLSGGNIAFDDIAVQQVPQGECPNASTDPLQAPLTIESKVFPTTMTVNATAVNQIVTSPSSVPSGSGEAASTLNFVTYTGTTPGAQLPYYTQQIGNVSSLGTVGYVTLNDSTLSPAPASAPTAPIAGAFSPDNTLFFVSTSGDNAVHYISTTTLKDTQQVTPNLPACNPSTDQGCTYTGTDKVVPATVITVKPRATT